ncbi:MAG: zf-HC2 domain-containing protein [Rudaea sp.]
MLRINCQQASRLLSQAEDEALPLGRRLRLRLHLVYCDACRTVSRQLTSLRLAMRAWRDRS